MAKTKNTLHLLPGSFLFALLWGELRRGGLGVDIFWRYRWRLFVERRVGMMMSRRCMCPHEDGKASCIRTNILNTVGISELCFLREAFLYDVGSEFYLRKRAYSKRRRKRD